MGDPLHITLLAVILILGAIDIGAMLRRQKKLREESSTIVSWTVFVASALFCAYLYPSTRMRTMFHVFFVVGLVIWPAIGFFRQPTPVRALATLVPRMGLYIYTGYQIEA
jgi:ABC-type Mn2+/Zn2+ transport system permease subunit